MRKIFLVFGLLGVLIAAFLMSRKRRQDFEDDEIRFELYAQ
ncbi:LPXTG cell wall anchor domain-containing protein [Candidatus Thermokryptus mobilis]|nr:LPXTG cell wall anchor domain-containing protein [Candidatus Thermokryptus mobilis]